jgi:hypothetical protein
LRGFESKRPRMPTTWAPPEKNIQGYLPEGIQQSYKTSRTGAAHVMAELKSSIPRRRDAFASLVLKRARRGPRRQDHVLSTSVHGRVVGTNEHKRRHQRPQHLPWINTLIDHVLGPSCKGRGHFPPSVWRCGNPSPSRYFGGKRTSSSI